MDKKYYDCLGSLVSEMKSREFTAYMYRKVFDMIYCVAYYRQQLNNADTPESAALARLALAANRGYLNQLMSDYGFGSVLQCQVRYLSECELSVSEL